MLTYSARSKELDRGRLLFVVAFQGGKGYLDPLVSEKELFSND
jgi:hypothetical protein